MSARSSTRPRIALVSEHASPLAALGGADAGGQNVHVAALAAELASLGCQVVVHTRRDDPDLPSWVPIGPGVAVDHLDAGPPLPIGKDDLYEHMDAFAAALQRRWWSRPPDIAHSHFWMSGYAAAHAAGPLRVPLVHTFHALGVVKRRHQGDRDTSPAARAAVEAALLHQADRIVATCGDEQGELVALGGDPSRIDVVPCGVDLDVFTPDGPAEPRSTGRHRLVSVGRLVERKGVDDLIVALAEVPDAELVVAGGPAAADLDRDPDVARLRAVAVTAGVADRVELRGRLDRGAVATLLRSADLAVCVPWYEPFGIVPLEAMACGVPVVASAVGGLLDTVVEGVTGLHVPPRDPAALATTLRRVFAAPEFRAAAGEAAAERAAACFGWRSVAEQTLDSYRRVVPGLGDGDPSIRFAAHQVAAVSEVGRPWP